MKHDWRVSLQLLGWVLVALLLSFWAAPYVNAARGPQPEAPWYVMLGVIIAAMTLSFFGWMKLIRTDSQVAVTCIFSISAGVIVALVMSALFLDRILAESIVMLLAARGIIASIVGLTFYYMVLAMRSSWEWTLRLSPYSNLLFAVVISFAALTISNDVQPWFAVLLLVLASLYDAWAVWRSKSMVTMAKFFVKARVFPGVMVPKRKRGAKEDFGMIGGGDVFFIILVAVSLMKYGAWMYVAGLSMFGGLTVLMLLSEKKKFYPALPFILAGLAVGGVFGWAVGL